MICCSSVSACEISINSSTSRNKGFNSTGSIQEKCVICPSCGYHMKLQDKGFRNDLPSLPAGVKFDPTDQEILEHLEARVAGDPRKRHPLIDEFIPTIDGDHGICYTHPEKLPGISNDGQIRHYFHRPSKAYTTGTRKRRKVQTSREEGNETRWHKTGKTRRVFVSGTIKGYKKILVLYTNYGRQMKPEKTNWVMHQYHLGTNEDEKDGELVISKVFYQTQPRVCSSVTRDGTPGRNAKTQYLYDILPVTTDEFLGLTECCHMSGQGSAIFSPPDEIAIAQNQGAMG